MARKIRAKEVLRLLADGHSQRESPYPMESMPARGVDTAR